MTLAMAHRYSQMLGLVGLRYEIGKQEPYPRFVHHLQKMEWKIRLFSFQDELDHLYNFLNTKKNIFFSKIVMKIRLTSPYHRILSGTNVNKITKI